MLRHTPSLLISLLHRRKWEQRVATVLAERTDVEKTNAAKRFERIYEKKQFTRIEDAFPLEHHLQKPKQTSSSSDEPQKSANPALREVQERFPSHHGLPSAFPINHNRKNPDHNRKNPPPTVSAEAVDGTTTQAAAEDMLTKNYDLFRRAENEKEAKFVIPSLEELRQQQNNEHQSDADGNIGSSSTANTEEDSNNTSSPSSSSSSMHLHPHVCSVAFLGPQNSGKSSLINALSHRHTNIESNRAGTTKSNQNSYFTVHDTQVTLMDTPGLVIPAHYHKLDRQQQKQQHNKESGASSNGGGNLYYKQRRKNAADALEAWESLYVNDVVALTLPVGAGGFVDEVYQSISREVLRRAAKRDLPVVLVFTKMDLIQTRRQKELYTAFRADVERMSLPIAASFETSCIEGTGLVDLKDFLRGYGKPGLWSRAKIEHSELTPSQHFGTLLQQVFFDLLPHEIPHELKYRVIGWTKKENGGLEIVVEVFFHRPSYLFTFYGKLETLSMAVQRLVEREMQTRVFVVFQAFLTPGGVSKNAQ